MPVIDRLMREYHQIADLPFAGDLDRKTSLLLVNSHVALDFAEEIPANVIPVAGLHIQEPKPLPDVLKKMLVLMIKT
jgi:glucuronosyltransferase